jgi:type II secretory pathway component PulF
MPTFAYEAMRMPGETVRGEIEADTAPAASLALISKGYHVLTVEEIGGGHAFSFRRIRRAEVTRFTRDLSVLLKSGLPLSSALRTQRANHQKEEWVLLLTNLRARLEDGASFSEALGAFPRAFDAVYVNLVRAGEESGKLPETLDRLARLYEQRDEIRSRVVLAMVYPCVLMGLGAITVAIMMTFVVPMFTGVFKETGESLPWPTQALVAISGALGKSWWVVFIALCLLGLIMSRVYKLAGVQQAIGRLMINLPLIQRVTRTIQVGSFARTAGSLLESGVPIVSALRISESTLSNPIYRTAVHEIAERVHGGDVLSNAMTNNPLFQPALISIISVGEHSGTLAESLQGYADQLDRELDREVRVVMTLLEPAMIVLLGLVVGFIVISMLLPIFSLGDTLEI